MKKRYCETIKGTVNDTLCVGRYLKQLDCCGDCEKAAKLSKTVGPSVNFAYKCRDGCGTAVPVKGVRCSACKGKRCKSGQMRTYARTKVKSKVVAAVS